MSTFTAPFGDGNTRITAEKHLDCGTEIYHTHSYKICTDNFCLLTIAKGERERIYEVTPNNLRTLKSCLWKLRTQIAQSTPNVFCSSCALDVERREEASCH
jgi:hypothetical protein